MIRKRLLRLCVFMVAAGLSAFVLGFFVFAAIATREATEDRAQADGIVVLTGGGARIGEAARLLEQGRGRRLLISGVNRRTGRDALKRLTGLQPETFDCCVDIGYAALDTSGNADEARAWTRKNGFSSLLIVTATYHMPRSLAELGRALPGVTLIPHAVVPRDFRTSGWWLYPGTAKLLASEYLKFLSAAARLAAQRLVWSNTEAAARAVRRVLPNQAGAHARSPRRRVFCDLPMSDRAT